MDELKRTNAQTDRHTDPTKRKEDKKTEREDCDRVSGMDGWMGGWEKRAASSSGMEDIERRQALKFVF